jgi:hypothetical protein
LVPRGIGLRGRRKIMLNERRTAANDVARKLFELEAAIDQALVCAGQLAATIPQARINAKLSAVVGQDAFDLVSESLTSLCAARGKTVAAHNALAEVHEQIGLKVFAGGDLWKLVKSVQPELTLVSKQAA